ncbi:MAG: helix-turn-helix domain-containing protein [Rhodocyclales bacterium]|nr:helix-turn-helix domain-containing protein [Rhodocyclales bacterium]
MLLTIPATAARMGVSRRTVEREIADGRLPVVGVRGARRVDEADLEAYIARSRITNTRPCPSENEEIGGMSAFRSAASASSAALDRLLQKRTPWSTKPDCAAT